MRRVSCIVLSLLYPNEGVWGRVPSGGLGAGPQESSVGTHSNDTLAPGVIDLGRCLVAQTLMGPLTVVELEVTLQALLQLGYCLIGPQIDVLILHTPPKAFNEDIVERPTTTVHADGNTLLLPAMF